MKSMYVGSFLLVFIILFFHSTSLSGTLDYGTAYKLMQEAKTSYPNKVPGGPVSETLFRQYAKKYGLKGSSFDDCCVLLVKSSLERCKNPEELQQEIKKILTLQNGFLTTMGHIFIKYNLPPDKISIDIINRKITNKKEATLLKTTLLADNLCAAWSFVIGMVYYQYMALNPSLNDPVENLLSQTVIDERLKMVSFHMQ